MNENLNTEGVNLYETGITPEDILKKSHNGMAPRKSYDMIPWKNDSEVYDPANLVSIKITNTTPVIQVGGFLKLDVEQTPKIANLPELCWESSNLEVAWVSSEGIVYAVSEGQTTIKVSKPASSIVSTVIVLVTSDGKAPEEPEEEEPKD